MFIQTWICYRVRSDVQVNQIGKNVDKYDDWPINTSKEMPCRELEFSCFDYERTCEHEDT